jgi:hypothetical protein
LIRRLSPHKTVNRRYRGTWKPALCCGHATVSARPVLIPEINNNQPFCVVMHYVFSERDNM